jgi:hypothetical protein
MNKYLNITNALRITLVFLAVFTGCGDPRPPGTNRMFVQIKPEEYRRDVIVTFDDRFGRTTSVPLKDSIRGMFYKYDVYEVGINKIKIESSGRLLYEADFVANPERKREILSVTRGGVTYYQGALGSTLSMFESDQYFYIGYPIDYDFGIGNSTNDSVQVVFDTDMSVNNTAVLGGVDKRRKRAILS